MASNIIKWILFPLTYIACMVAMIFRSWYIILTQNRAPTPNELVEWLEIQVQRYGRKKATQARSAPSSSSSEDTGSQGS